MGGSSKAEREDTERLRGEEKMGCTGEERRDIDLSQQA